MATMKLRRDSLSRERELDRAALKSALRALEHLLRDDGATASCEHGDGEGRCYRDREEKRSRNKIR